MLLQLHAAGSVTVVVGASVGHCTVVCPSFCFCLTVVLLMAALDHCHCALSVFLSVVDPTHISAPADSVALLPSLVAAQLAPLTLRLYRAALAVVCLALMGGSPLTQ
jgi:hypothetical protein